MARVTIEDCLHVGNRFMLCLLASQRAIEINDGSKPRVMVSEHRPEKPTVIALREIAAGNLPKDS